MLLLLGKINSFWKKLLLFQSSLTCKVFDVSPCLVFDATLEHFVSLVLTDRQLLSMLGAPTGDVSAQLSHLVCACALVSCVMVKLARVICCPLGLFEQEATLPPPRKKRTADSDKANNLKRIR